MRRSGPVLFAAISLALHLAWVMWLPKGQHATQPATHWVEVAFEIEPPAASAPSLSEEALALHTTEQPALEARRQEQQAEHSPVQPKAAQPEARKPERQPKPAESKQPELAPPSVPTPAHAVEQPPSQLAAAEPAPKPIAIMPRTAALTLDGFSQGGALRCTGRVAAGQKDCGPTEQETGRAAQAALTRDLDAAAHRVAHLKGREHAKLKRRSDGSYAYDGHVFQAVVRTDGNVEFRDNAIEGELRVSPVPFLFTADLNDVIERHVLGRELYSAEKQWLLEETRELRNQLAGEYRRREQQGANRELERVLQGVLDDTKLTLAKKHEAIFLLWQDCGEDAQAAAHRKAVDSFVRRYLPQGSALGFLAEELEQFNRERGRLQKFEPYAGS